jgi:hypothetical protein
MHCFFYVGFQGHTYNKNELKLTQDRYSVMNVRVAIFHYYVLRNSALNTVVRLHTVIYPSCGGMLPLHGVSSYTGNLSLYKSVYTLLYPKRTDRQQHFVQRLHTNSISISEEKRRLQERRTVMDPLLCVHLRIFLIKNNKTAWGMVTDVQNLSKPQSL